jgi:hypothetical protein
MGISSGWDNGWNPVLIIFYVWLIIKNVPQIKDIYETFQDVLY